MKIAAGALKGMSFRLPSGQGPTRPTSDKIRQATLNSLHGELEGAIFADLFSGTGAVGCEALSRGASACLFFEADPKACQVIRTSVTEARRRFLAQNLAAPTMDLITTPISATSSRLLTPFWRHQVDFAWADPPYDQTSALLGVVLDLAHALLKSEGLFLLECRAVEAEGFISELSDQWEAKKTKKYGDTAIIFLTPRSPR